MAVVYGKFEMPEIIGFDDETATDEYARFIAEPFERGFGHTIGNSIRRMMLSSLEAPGIVSVRIEGVPHEYMAVDGIIEDMTNIILNLKGALLRKLPMEDEANTRDYRLLTTSFEVTQEDLDKNGGQITITLGDLIQSGDYEVINPELQLFNVTKPMKKQVDFRIRVGRGYVPSERHEVEDKVVDEIVIDTTFSPVRRVNYFVENTRVGQDTDYDRLILEITTDGRITPQEALTFVTQIGIKHLEVFQKVQTHDLTFEETSVSSDVDNDDILRKLMMRINEIELSVRASNCLNGADIDTIAELVIKPESDMLKFRNFGKKSLNEIKAKLTEMGLSLGMDLSKFGITLENVKDVVNQYHEANS